MGLNHRPPEFSETLALCQLTKESTSLSYSPMRRMWREGVDLNHRTLGYPCSSFSETYLPMVADMGLEPIAESL